MMRSMLVALCAVAWTPAATAQDMFGVTWTGQAWAVDSSGPSGTLLGGVGAADLNGLTVVNSNTAYAVGANDQLITIDPLTGLATASETLPIADFRALAWDEAKQMLLAIHQASPGTSTPDELWQIDPLTLITTLIGDTGLPGLQGLDVAPDGTIYAYDVGPGGGQGVGLVTLDPVTGAATDVYPAVDNGGLWQWVAVSPAGEVLVGADVIFRVEPMTGIELPQGPTGASGLRGLDFIDDSLLGVYCFGDGSGSPCPCGNDAVEPTGCVNSTGLGALLTRSGSSSVAADLLQLNAAGLPASQPGLYFQGSNAVAGGDGVAFGDGLRCAGMNVVRLQTVSASAGGSSSTDVAIAAKGGASAGDTRWYQLWYRDPSGSPCGLDFNLSNGLEVVWLP